MRCENCGIEMKPNAKFCHLCGEPDPAAGAPLPTRLCKTCGSEMAREAVYCPNCGMRDEPILTVVTHTEAQAEEQQEESRQALGTASLILMAHTLMSVVGLVEHFVERQYLGNTAGFFELLFRDANMIPHWLLLVVAAVFSLVGWAKRKTWAYMVSAIIQCVSIPFAIFFFVGNFSILVTYAVLVLFGFGSMSLLKRRGY